MRINIKLESDAFQEDPNYKTYSTLPVIKVHFFFNIFLNLRFLSLPNYDKDSPKMSISYYQ